MRFVVFLALGLFALIPTASADCVSQCVASTYCYGDDSYATCSRRSSHCYSLQCEDEEGVYIYGAIAYDKDSGAWGLSHQSADKERAESSALSFCADNGENCRIVESFTSTCAAIAESEEGWETGWGLGDEKEDASEEAMKDCNRKNSGQDCSVSKTNCYY